MFGQIFTPELTPVVREALLKYMAEALGIARIALAPPPSPRCTQTGTLGHFVSEKSAPNYPGKGLDPPKSSKCPFDLGKFLSKKVPQTIRARVEPPPPLTGNAQMPAL